MTMNQHEAVVHAVKHVMGERFQKDTDIKTYISKEEKQRVVELVVEMFGVGLASLSDDAKAKFSDKKSLTTYTIGMVTNWFNKSKELNGGIKYEAKNPGSRVGACDAQLKELKNLRARVEASGNTEGIAKIDAAIQARLTELKTELLSKKLPEVDLSKIPEHLRGLIE